MHIIYTAGVFHRIDLMLNIKYKNTVTKKPNEVTRRFPFWLCSRSGKKHPDEKTTKGCFHFAQYLKKNS